MFQKYGNMEIYGTVNNIEDSGWRVDIPIKDNNTLDFENRYLGFYVKVGGKAL